MELIDMIDLCIVKSKGKIDSKFLSNGDMGEITITFTPEQIEHYTKLVIKHAVEKTVELEGKTLGD